MVKKGVVIKTSVLAGCVAVALCGCGDKTDNANMLAGMGLVEQFDFQGALEDFDLALLNNEDLELTYRGRGLAYMGLGEYAEAQDAFLESIANADNKLTDLEYDTNYYLAASYMKQEKYAEAEEIYTAIISLKKKEKDAYYLRACAIIRQGRYEEALEDFEKAFSFDSSDIDLVTDAYVEMQAAGYGDEGRTYLQDFLDKNDKKLGNGEKGVIYYYLEDYDNARICLDTYINGNDADLALILGQTYEKLGDMNYATVVYQTFLNSNVPTPAIYNSLGICLMNQQKYSEAKEAFQNGIDLGSSDYMQELKFNLIVANEYMGDFASAKTMLSEYLKSYPDDTKARRESEFLNTR
jgi:tetratricopeptide (TPR) repeat protein